MAIEAADFESVLQEALTERDTVLQETEMPEINIGLAVPVGEDLSFDMETFEFGVTSSMGSVRDGIIGNKTNSLKTLDTAIEMHKAPAAQWAKAQTWTIQEAEKIARLGINVQSAKIDELYANAMATLQYAGYVGHEDVVGQVGLLNGNGVTLITDATNKTIADMTAQEFIDMILNAYQVAWRASNYSVQPTHIAMDADDFMSAMAKFDASGTVVGLDLLPVSAMDKVMAALRKASGNESFSVEFVKVPSGYARGIKSGKTRLAIYTHDNRYLEMQVVMPQLLPVRARDLLTLECGYREAFTGVMWKQPKSAVYVDYKTSAK